MPMPVLDPQQGFSSAETISSSGGLDSDVRIMSPKLCSSVGELGSPVCSACRSR